MTKKLIALDMDGTFLSSQKEIPTENLKAVQEAQVAGHVVMACTGRPYESLKIFLTEQGLSDLPISANNGALTVVEDQVIHQVSMNTQTTKELFDWLDKNEYPFNFYTNQGVFSILTVLERAKKAFALAPPSKDEHALNIELLEIYLTKSEIIYFETWEELPEDLEVYKIYISTPDPAKKLAVETFAQQLPGLTITSSYFDNVELSDEKGHKGTGLTAVANHFNIPMKETVAIGDNFNDEGMLEAAGYAVAMGNAEDKIKEMSDMVTLTNDECGVAYAIRKLILK